MAVDIVLCERDQPHRVLLAGVLEVQGYGVDVTSSVDHAVERWRRAESSRSWLSRWSASSRPRLFRTLTSPGRRGYWY